MLVSINTDLICTFKLFLGVFFPRWKKNTLNFFKQMLAFFHAYLMIPLIKLLKIVPFDENVDVAKFTCSLLIYVPNCVGW